VWATDLSSQKVLHLAPNDFSTRLRNATVWRPLHARVVGQNFHRNSQLTQVQKVVIGSSPERVCTWTKRTLVLLQSCFGHWKMPSTGSFSATIE
jgi:hypothetical protein